MNLENIPKRSWRARIIETFYEITGRDKVPYNKSFFTLGAGARKKDSEYNYLINRNFIKPYQYVSVEKDIGLHRSNCIIKGPKWLYGDWIYQFENWSQYYSNKPAIISCDLMCGADNALPIIRATLATLYKYNKIVSDEKTQITFNICAALTISTNTRSQLPPVWKTIGQDRFVVSCIENGLKLVDRFQYRNKTVGKGAGASTMETISFAW